MSNTAQGVVTHAAARAPRLADKLPTRQQEDNMALRVYCVRVDARLAILRSPGVARDAYLGVLRASVRPAKSGYVGDPTKPSRSKPAAGKRTQEALDLLGMFQWRTAAGLDLDSDPGCLAIDAARDALITLLASGAGSAEDQRAREAIREFDREVGLVVVALRAVVPVLLRSHRAWWGPSRLQPCDALAAGMDGLRKSVACYRISDKGSTSISTFARKHGWILRAFQQAEPPRFVEPLTGEADPVDALPAAEAQDPFETAEQELVAARREEVARALIARGLEAVRGKDIPAARGLAALAEGREVQERREWTGAVRLLRSMLGNTSLAALTVCG